MKQKQDTLDGLPELYLHADTKTEKAGIQSVDDGRSKEEVWTEVNEER